MPKFSHKRTKLLTLLLAFLLSFGMFIQPQAVRAASLDDLKGEKDRICASLPAYKERW